VATTLVKMPSAREPIHPLAPTAVKNSAIPRMKAHEAGRFNALTPASRALPAAAERTAWTLRNAHASDATTRLAALAMAAPAVMIAERLRVERSAEQAAVARTDVAAAKARPPITALVEPNCRYPSANA
jgi:hypothetical protein